MDNYTPFGIFWLVVAFIAIPLCTHLYYSRKQTSKVRYNNRMEAIKVQLEQIKEMEQVLRTEYSISVGDRMLTNRVETALSENSNSGKQFESHRITALEDKLQRYSDKLSDKLKSAKERHRIDVANVTRPASTRKLNYTSDAPDCTIALKGLYNIAEQITEATNNLRRKHGVAILWDSSGHIDLHINYVYFMQSKLSTKVAEVNAFIEKLTMIHEVMLEAYKLNPNDRAVKDFLHDNLDQRVFDELTVVFKSSKLYTNRQRKWRERPPTTSITTPRNTSHRSSDDTDIMILHANNMNNIHLYGNEAKESPIHTYEGNGGSFGGGGASSSWSNPSCGGGSSHSSNSDSSGGSSSTSDGGGCSGGSD